MAGFLDVLLRGWILAVAAAAAALAQACTLLVALAEVGGPAGWPIGAFLGTTFARAALLRVGLAVAIVALAATLARRAAGPGAWRALGAMSLALVVTSAVLSHAVARVEGRAALLALDAIHQVAAAVWIGGLAHLTLWAARRRTDAPPADGTTLLRRFSNLALGSVVTLVVAGVALSWLYIGDAAAYVGTAYGVMVLSKALLLAAILALALANLRAVRGAAPADSPRLLRFVEVELGLGLTVLFAAASLTSLPPAVDVAVADRATVAEVAGRFVPTVPRLTSPPVAELIGKAAFLFFLNDPRAWPLGPAGFWESFLLPDVLQHRTFVLLIAAFATFEWMVRTERLARRPWGYVFPLLCAIGGGLLLTHSHAMFNLKYEFLTEVTHAPLGVLGAFTGWGRWVELRLPDAGRTPGWLSTLCLTVVGVILV